MDWPNLDRSRPHGSDPRRPQRLGFQFLRSARLAAGQAGGGAKMRVAITGGSGFVGRHLAGAPAGPRRSAPKIRASAPDPTRPAYGITVRISLRDFLGMSGTSASSAG